MLGSQSELEDSDIVHVFRERCVGMDAEPIVPRPPLQPKSSLSMMIDQQANTPKRSNNHERRIKTLVPINNKFSCQQLLETVTEFHREHEISHKRLPKPISAESLRLYAAEEDGTPDYELPEFNKSSDVFSMGINEFAVVDNTSQIVHVRLSSESDVQEFIFDEIESPLTVPAQESTPGLIVDEPDFCSFYEDEEVSGASRRGSTGSQQGAGDPSFIRAISSPPLPNLIVGKWVSASPIPVVDLVPPVPAARAPSMDRASRTSSLDIRRNSSVDRDSCSSDNSILISLRVPGSQTWSVAGRISYDRLSVNSFDDYPSEVASTAASAAAAATAAANESKARRTRYPSFVAESDANDSFSSMDSDASPRSREPSRRVLVAYSDSDSEDTAHPKAKSSKIPIRGALVIPDQDSPHSMNSVDSGFFGEMSPPAFVRNLDTGEIFDLATLRGKDARTGGPALDEGTTVVTASMLFGRRN